MESDESGAFAQSGVYPIAKATAMNAVTDEERFLHEAPAIGRRVRDSLIDCADEEKTTAS